MRRNALDVRRAAFPPGAEAHNTSDVRLRLLTPLFIALAVTAARDVLEGRQAEPEQAALRRVATLVAGGAPPEDLFAAVVAGHVDSRSGPAVFYRLRALLRGDRIRLTLADGTIVRFAVTGTKAVSKRRFPTRLVYRKTARPTLRLITCDGAFDRSTGHYVDNYLVFGRLLSVWDKPRSPRKHRPV